MPLRLRGLTFPPSISQILYRRAVRLRKMTGNNNLKTQGEIESSETSWSDLASQTLVRPLVLFLEPIVLILNLYIALIYALRECLVRFWR